MNTQISYQMGDGQNVTGEIPVSLDNFVFSEIEENIVMKKLDIDRHYQFVMASNGSLYQNVNKHDYGNILQAFKVIVNCKRYHQKSPAKIKAVAFLHQEMKLSPSTIQRVLLLLGVKISSSEILKNSEKMFALMPKPVWIERCIGGMI